MAKKNKETALTQEQEITISLVAQAQKLGLLLANSTMPEDIKESWLAILPEMSIEQIQQLLDILEAKYLDSQTKDIDEKFKKKIEKELDKFQKKDAKIEKEVEKKAKELKKILSKNK
ncbi:MAG: hypothetical protein Q7R99_04295 [bacterium]|nr:hypothetical protein [bacterium]